MSLKRNLKKSFVPTKDFQLRNFFNVVAKLPLFGSRFRSRNHSLDAIQLQEFQDKTLHNQSITKQSQDKQARLAKPRLVNPGLVKPGLKIVWWAWLTVLSLDAPLVAIAWQALLAESFQLALRPVHSLLLFAVVWLIYVADRCFDSVVIDEAQTERHAFYKRHFRPVVFVAIFVAIVVLFVAVRGLEPTLFLHGCLLSGIVLLYLANLHLLKEPILLLPKELQIGIVFAVGTGLSLWSQLDASTVVLFSLATLCFASLCFLNCSFISLWEKSVDVLHQQPSLARTTDVHKLSNVLQLAVISLCALSLLLPFDLSLKIAFGLSSMGLWLVNYTKISTKLKRVLADVVLMSPLLVLMVIKLS